VPGMKDQTEFRTAAARLMEGAPKQARPSVEQALVTAFRARRRQRSLRACAAGAIGLIILAVACLGVRYASAPVKSQHSEATAGGFVLLPYAQSDVPLEQGVIVRMRIAPREMQTIGVPVGRTNADGTVNADLLVGQDGVARAVRVVQ